MKRTAAIAGFFLAAAFPAAAQTADDCYQATLKTDDAAIIRICTRVLQKGGLENPTLSTTLANRGLGYLRNKEFDKSIIDFSEALLINPKNPYAFNSRGEAWREKGNLDRALTDFDESLRVDPTFAAAYLNRGITFERQNDPSAARTEYQKALDQKGKRAIDDWARRNARTRLTNLDGDKPRTPDRQPQRDRDRNPDRAPERERNPDDRGRFRDGMGSDVR